MNDGDDYIDWPLEKLQNEYNKLRTQNAGLQLRETMAIQAQKEVEDLAKAFNNFLRQDES